jgi:cobalamin biosynthetic protein CobC
MVRELGRPASDWLDLSTGINPHAWDAPTPPPATWYQLPDPHDGLIPAARDYYATQALLPVPGSQAALAMLPWLRARSRVGVIDPGYAEHGAAWVRAGHDVMPLPLPQLAGGAGTAFDVLVVINPNNPDGTWFEPQTLLEWRARIASRGGWMVVDEAFVDPHPAYSLAPHAPLPGLLVLRSIGKFFGLAGMRIGFAMGPSQLLQPLSEALGPWSVNGPARWVAREALSDRAWQVSMRARLAREGERLGELLGRYFAQRVVGTALFRTVRTPQAAALFDALAQRGVLVRLLDHQDGLRFGLPPDEAGWNRLECALSEVVAGETSRA